ncbi:hypothetical protein B0H21DRAFT_220272 [Amylocystis lapponica]|nr:hypothetical protein B0H21DRAFT_220272 [Amylocystis lapponica]
MAMFDKTDRHLVHSRSRLGPLAIFPIEVAERIIDASCYTGRYFRHRDHATLRACALTCSSWLPRSRYHIFYTVTLTTRAKLMAFAKLLTTKPHLDALVHELRIPCTDRLGRRVGVQPLFSFPAVLARKLTEVTYLSLEGPWMLSWFTLQDRLVTPFPPTFWAISEMMSITELYLVDIAFGSVGDLASLVCAIPHLCTLRCTNVRTIKPGRNPFAIAHGLKLETLAFVASESCSIGLQWLLLATGHFLRQFYFSYFADLPDLKPLTALQTLVIRNTSDSKPSNPGDIRKMLASCLPAPDLHTLALQVIVENYDALGSADWARLDEFLATSFSHVETIVLYIFARKDPFYEKPMDARQSFRSGVVIMPHIWIQRTVIDPDYLRRPAFCYEWDNIVGFEGQDFIDSDRYTAHNPSYTRQAYVFSRHM